MAKQLLQLQDLIGDAVEDYYNYVKNNGAWRTTTIKAAFDVDFANIRQVAKTQKQNKLEKA